MTNPGANEPLKSVSGAFYVGMRKEDLKETGLAIANNVLNSVFDTIDQDKDGVLSEKEICDLRDAECRNIKEKHEDKVLNTCTAGSGMMVGGNVFGPVGSVIGLLSGAIVTLVGVGIDIFGNDGSSEQEITDNYRKEHGLS